MGKGVKPFADKKDVFNIEQKHFTTFLNRIAKDLRIEIDQIVDFEFNAYDAHKPSLTGLHKEFVSS